MTATYLGIKGTRGAQQFLPNTYPIGAANPAPPARWASFIRPRAATPRANRANCNCAAGCAAASPPSLLYTYSKSIDDDAQPGRPGSRQLQQPKRRAILRRTEFRSRLGTRFGRGHESATQSGSTQPAIAQNWLNLRAERGLSTFDQRHLLNLQAQYTSGEGMGGGTLMGGWTGRLLKEWTVEDGSRGHRPARDADLSRGGPGHGIQRHHSTRPYRRANLDRPAQVRT